MYGVTITELIEKMNMKNVTPEIDTDKDQFCPIRKSIVRLFS